MKHYPIESAAVNPRALAALAVTGFWFCESCERVTERIDHDYLPAKCARCGSPRITWNPAVVKFQPTEARHE